MSLGQTANQVVCGLAHPGECSKDVVVDQKVCGQPFPHKTERSSVALALCGRNRVALAEISDFGSPYVVAGGAARVYLPGIGMHRPHLAETRRSGAEATVDASIVADAIKLATDCQRPDSA
jgi:hypothetical protein